MIRRSKLNSGFSLIELMVVIVIIGILATLGLSSFMNALKRGRDSKRMGIVQDVSSSQEQLKALTGEYATSCDVGDTVGELTIDQDPSSNSRYSCTATISSFCIHSELEVSNNGNCTGCTSESSFGTSTTNNTHFCVRSKQ